MKAGQRVEDLQDQVAQNEADRLGGQLRDADRSLKNEERFLEVLRAHAPPSPSGPSKSELASIRRIEDLKRNIVGLKSRLNEVGIRSGVVLNEPITPLKVLYKPR